MRQIVPKQLPDARNRPGSSAVAGRSCAWGDPRLDTRRWCSSRRLRRQTCRPAHRVDMSATCGARTGMGPHTKAHTPRRRTVQVVSYLSETSRQAGMAGTPTPLPSDATEPGLP